MSRFALVPLSRFAVRKEWLVGQSFPVHTIVADGHTDLLRPIVVGPRIEHIEPPLPDGDRSPLDTLTLPWQFRGQYRSIRHLAPALPVEVTVFRSHRYTQHLLFIVGIPRGKVEIILILEESDLRIDSPSAIPFTRRPEDRVGAVPLEVDAVDRNSVTDSVVPAISVSLIEEVNLSIPDQRARSAKPLCLIRGIGMRGDLTHFAPVDQVAALRNTDIPS